MQRDAVMNARRQSGFLLVTAIFLVTVLAALGAFLLVMSSVAQQTPALGLNGAQAYHAARSGLEFGISRAIGNAGTGCNTNLSLPPYEVQVSCAGPELHNDGGVVVDMFTVTAVATRGSPGEIAYARRELRAVVSSSGPN